MPLEITLQFLPYRHVQFATRIIQQAYYRRTLHVSRVLSGDRRYYTNAFKLFAACIYPPSCATSRFRRPMSQKPLSIYCDLALASTVSK
jgi:hypothetical protein